MESIPGKRGPKGPRTEAGYMIERKVNMDDSTWQICLSQPEGASAYLRSLVHRDKKGEQQLKKKPEYYVGTLVGSIDGLVKAEIAGALLQQQFTGDTRPGKSVVDGTQQGIEKAKKRLTGIIQEIVSELPGSNGLK